jgi:hypothetical protein
MWRRWRCLDTNPIGTQPEPSRGWHFTADRPMDAAPSDYRCSGNGRRDRSSPAPAVTSSPKAADIVHTYSPSLDGLAAIGVARLNRLPLVCGRRALWQEAPSTMARYVRGSVTGAVSLLDTHVIYCADAMATICERLRQEVTEHGRRFSRPVRPQGS